MKTPALLAFATVALAASASAAVIVPVFVSGVNYANLATETQLVNNSGLSTPVNTGATLAAAQAVTHVRDGNFAQSWVTTAPNGTDFFSGGQLSPTMIWDLGSDVFVNNIILWQYQNNGGGSAVGNNARLIDLRFNTAAQGTASFVGGATSITLQNTNTLTTNPAQTFATGGVTARYVQLAYTDNYFGIAGAGAGGDRVGLGELRFDASPVPEPSVALLGGLGLLGLLRRRR